MNNSKIERFENLIARQKARILTADIYRVTNQGDFAGDFGLRDQIRRAIVSVMSNNAEGFERFNANEFHHFLSISKAASGEVRSPLYVAVDAGYLAKEIFIELKTKCEELSRIINGLRASVKKQSTRHTALFL